MYVYVHICLVLRCLVPLLGDLHHSVKEFAANVDVHLGWSAKSNKLLPWAAKLHLLCSSFLFCVYVHFKTTYQSFHGRRVLQFRDFSKECGCHRTQSFLGPRREPINGTTVNQRRKLTKTRSKYLTDWTEEIMNPTIKTLKTGRVTKTLKIFKTKEVGG